MLGERHLTALMRNQVQVSAASWPAVVSFPQLLNISVGYAVGIYAGSGTLRKTRALRDVFDELAGVFALPGFNGLSIEPDTGGGELPTVLAAAAASGRVRICRSAARPEAVLSMLSAHDVPHSIDAMKLDTDGADVSILRGVLQAKYAPKVLCVRVNADVPPPMRFKVLHGLPAHRVAHNEADGGPHPTGVAEDGPVTSSAQTNRIVGLGLAGSSADELHAVASAYGYVLVAFEFGRAASGTAGHALRICTRCPQNAWLVRHELLPAGLVQSSDPPLGSWRRMNSAFWAQLLAQHAGMQAQPAKFLFSSRGKGAWMYDVLRSQAADIALRAWGSNASGSTSGANGLARRMEQPPENNSERCAW